MDGRAQHHTALVMPPSYCQNALQNASKHQAFLHDDEITRRAGLAPVKSASQHAALRSILRQGTRGMGNLRLQLQHTGVKPCCTDIMHVTSTWIDELHSVSVMPGPAAA